MRLLISLIFIATLASPAASQGFSCGQGRIIYATKYTDLFTTYPGTAAVLETCTATCGNQPAKDRQSCYLVACGLSCLVVGMNNCMEYFTQKSNVDSFKEGIEAICQVEEAAAKRQEQEADLLAWSLAGAKNSLDGYQDYLTNCNSVCRYRLEAKTKVAEFHIESDLTAWSMADTKSSLDGYQDYLKDCNSVCAHRSEAEEKISTFHKANDDAQWAVAMQDQTVGTMQEYLKSCAPTCVHSHTAQGFIDESVTAANKAQKNAIWGVLLAISLPIHPLHIMLRFAM